MSGEPEIPEPVKFNPLKHHKGFIMNFLEESTAQETEKLYNVICHNYIDIYTGKLPPEEICMAAIAVLKETGIFGKSRFKQWIAASSEYRKIKLPDQSEWVVREGSEPGRYIHIHPAKTGPYTIRFKGTTLKTAYSLKKGSQGSHQEFSLEAVNRARISIGLSPVKKLEKGKGIIHCRETLFQ